MAKEKQTGAKVSAKAAPKKMGLFARMKRYFREVGAELKKSTWPTKQELVKYTGIVLAFVLMFACIVGAMDWGLSSLLKLITG